MCISRYFVYFTIYSFLGWVYESTYCTIKAGKWENRGFLYGPVCPIYGVGALLLTMIDDYGMFHNVSYEWWQIFVIGFLGSIVLEYSTSYILEKLFHAYWWDYSDLPFNIHGRICLYCSLAFGFAALIVIYGIVPFTRDITSHIGPLAYEVLGLICMAFFAIDTTLTVTALSNFDKNVIAAEEVVNSHMESFVNNIQKKSKRPAFNLNLLKKDKENEEEIVTDEDENDRLSLEDLLSQERLKFAKAYTEKMVATMGVLPRSAVKRIKGYKRPEKERNSFETARELVKKYVANKRGKEND